MTADYPTGIWRHWKGHLYQVLFCARDATNGPGEGRTMVVYIGLTLDGTPTPGLRVRARDLAQWHETVEVGPGDARSRFTYVGAEWDPGMNGEAS